MTKKSQPQKRYERAMSSFHLASSQLVKAAETFLAEKVRIYYPEATGLAVEGEYAEEFIPHLEVTAVLIGSMTVDETDAVDYQPYQEGDPRTKFETMTEDIKDQLDWLLDLTGNEYIGKNEIEFDAAL